MIGTAVARLAVVTHSAALELSYVLPIKAARSQVESDLSEYIRWIAPRADVIVVDGSPPPVFDAHARAWGALVHHIAPAPDLATPMGKVGGVLTGIRAARHEYIIIADDDVRYDDASLRQVMAALDDADVVRPQNYFNPLPWHAAWDTGRTLLNRVSGGDWPGTLGVRRSVLRHTGGYDGSAMFENLELVRTVTAAGGLETVLLDAFVERRPSTTRHFWTQRVRQAYDELARPARLVTQLALLPAAVTAVAVAGPWTLAGAALLSAGIAEIGRRRAGGRRVFPVHASLLAPAWLAERAVCSWLAVGARVVLGGVPYRGTRLRHAATPVPTLQARFASNPYRRPPPEAARRRSA